MYCLDLRNHGDSPHNPRHDYCALAADVEAYMDSLHLGPSIIIGHSMGAKTAMAMSLRRPDLVAAMISVDNSPVNARLSAQFPKYIKGLQEIEAAKVKSSKEAYKILSKYEPVLTVQHFLLANLKRAKEKLSSTAGFHFRVPVDVLGGSLDKLADFPFSSADSTYSGPSLFIRGTKSN